MTIGSAPFCDLWLGTAGDFFQINSHKLKLFASLKSKSKWVLLLPWSKQHFCLKALLLFLGLVPFLVSSALTTLFLSPPKASDISICYVNFTNSVAVLERGSKPWRFISLCQLLGVLYKSMLMISSPFKVCVSLQWGCKWGISSSCRLHCG